MKKTVRKLRSAAPDRRENWQDLANAVVLQAVQDYRLSNDPRDLEELERFFLSDWFRLLTDLSPDCLLSLLRREKGVYS